MCVGGSRGGDQAAAEPQEDAGPAGQEGEQGGGAAPAGHDRDRGGGPGPGAPRSVRDLWNMEIAMCLSEQTLGSLNIHILCTQAS